MTRFDIMLGKENKKEEKGKLTLILEEGDDVLKSLKEGMDENKVREANVVGIDGELLEGIIKTDLGQERIEEIGLLNGKGKFKFGGDELWGKLEVFTKGKKPISGQLLKGIAKDLTIKLEF